MSPPTRMIADCRPDSPVTWQQHMSPPTRMIPDCRPGSPVTWQQHMSPPTRMIPDCRPGSPQQYMSPHTRMIRLPTRPSSYLTATHVTTHSYDTRLPTWQSSYMACHRNLRWEHVSPLTSATTQVVHLLALLRIPRNNTRRRSPIQTTIETRLPTWQSSYLICWTPTS